MTLYRNTLALIAVFVFGAATIASASANYAGSAGVTYIALGLTFYAARSVSLDR